MFSLIEYALKFQNNTCGVIHVFIGAFLFYLPGLPSYPIALIDNRSRSDHRHIQVGL